MNKFRVSSTQLFTQLGAQAAEQRTDVQLSWLGNGINEKTKYSLLYIPPL